MILADAFDRTTRRRWSGTKNHEEADRLGRRVLELLGGETPVREVTPARVARLVVDPLRGGGMAPATVNRHLSALGAVLQEAHRAGAIPAVPRLPREDEPRGRERVLSPEEEPDLLRALRVPDPRADHLVVFLLDTGMRVGEALALHYGRDLLLADGSRADVRDPGPRWVAHVRTSKNGRSRVVPVSRRAREAVAEAVAAGTGDSATVWGFTYPRLRHRWDLARAALGLRGDREFTLHMLRHTCATRLVRRGVALPVVRRWMGHQSATTTLRYAHADTGDLLAAGEAGE